MTQFKTDPNFKNNKFTNNQYSISIHRQACLAESTFQELVAQAMVWYELGYETKSQRFISAGPRGRLRRETLSSLPLPITHTHTHTHVYICTQKRVGNKRARSGRNNGRKKAWRVCLFHTVTHTQFNVWNDVQDHGGTKQRNRNESASLSNYQSTGNNVQIRALIACIVSKHTRT